MTTSMSMRIENDIVSALTRALRSPLFGPLAAGAAVRLVAAWSGWGIFASDDYTHVIEMAWRWLEDASLPFNSRIRSELAARIAWVVFRGARSVGIDGPEGLLKMLYTVLGAYSLIAIPGVYALTRTRFDESSARTAAWLMAIEAAIPRLSTRALISMLSIPPLVWGLFFAERARVDPGRTKMWAVLAGVLISASALFRFQLGIVFVLVGALLAYDKRSVSVGAAFFAGGLLGLAAQLGLDRHAFGSWTPAPLLYVQYNLEESTSFGVGPWYSYFGMFLLLTLPPATFAVAPGLWRAAKEQWLLSIPFAIFLVVHSAIPHKEERFLFPLIPIFFVALSVGLVDAWRRGGWRRGLVRWFWGANAVLLAAASISDAHRNVTTVMLEAGREGFDAFYGVGDMLVPVFYLSDGDTAGYHVKDTKVLRTRLDASPPGERIRVLFDHTPKEWELRALGDRGSCEPPFLSHGDLVDQLLVWVNPIGNRHRRGPKTVVDCVLSMV